MDNMEKIVITFQRTLSAEKEVDRLSHLLEAAKNNANQKRIDLNELLKAKSKEYNHFR